MVLVMVGQRYKSIYKWAEAFPVQPNPVFTSHLSFALELYIASEYFYPTPSSKVSIYQNQLSERSNIFKL